MQVKKLNIQRIYSKPYNSSSPEKQNSEKSCGLQNSLYNTKGVYIPFCGLAKGQDFIEESCISLLRKARENRCRKFAEDDIREILTDLRKSKSPEDKPHIIQEALTIENPETGEQPSKNFIKKVIKLTAGKPEAERFALLEFAQSELKTAAAPLKVFSQLPEDKQTKLTKILKEINNANDKELYKSKDDWIETIDSAYDIFRTAVYAHDDISRLDARDADAYKIKTLKMLYSDKNYMQNLDVYSCDNAREKIVSIAQNVINYFCENIL